MNAVITGATKGIGRAIAIALAHKGYNLAICSRNAQELDELERELELKYGVAVMSSVVDCSSKAAVYSFINKVKDSFKHIHVLVNNAGVFVPGELLTEEDGNLEQMIAVHLLAPYYLFC